jgi:hypothetical protein
LLLSISILFFLDFPNISRNDYQHIVPISEQIPAESAESRRTMTSARMTAKSGASATDVLVVFHTDAAGRGARYG